MHFDESSFYELAQDIFPLCRSISGNGVRKTLRVIGEHIPLHVHEFPTGLEAFDWTIPKEWNVKNAYITDPDGNKIANFENNNLHLMGYSIPFRGEMSLSELDKHLYSLPDFPEAIPYVTSYFKERWGFCLSHKQRTQLCDGIYKVFVDTSLEDGSLTFADLVIPGKSKKEILISTYTCHPSMANNEVSGMTVTTMLAKWLASRENNYYTYRIVFGPETIGPIAYMSTGNRLATLQKNVVAAFNMTCVGDERAFSLLPTKWGNRMVDRVARHTMNYMCPNYIEYNFCNDRGSDECQYSSPGIDLPMLSIMRTKYGCYSEYHTSFDDMSLITGAGMKGAFDVVSRCIEVFEFGATRRLRSLVVGEPFFSKYNLRSTIDAFDLDVSSIRKLSNIMAYADTEHTLLDVAELMNIPVWDLFDSFNSVRRSQLVEYCDV